MVRIFDYESKDCGFESHRDLELLLLLSISSPLYMLSINAAAANEWVCSTVGSRRLLRMREVTGSSPVESTFCFCLVFCCSWPPSLSFYLAALGMYTQTFAPLVTSPRLSNGYDMSLSLNK